MRRLRPPRWSDLGSSLYLRALEGHWDADELDRSRRRIKTLHCQTLNRVWTEGSEWELEREAISTALEDAYLLLRDGLEQMEQALREQDLARLRRALLILEKGEEEYLWLLREAPQDDPPPRGQRSRDLWGKVESCLGRAEADSSENPSDWRLEVELTYHQHLLGTQRDFRRALELAATDPEKGRQRLLASWKRLGDFLGVSSSDAEGEG